MNVGSLRFWSWSALLLVGACAAKRLPPGTPPPEYEPRPVIPWDESLAAPAPEMAPAEAAVLDAPSDAGVSEAPDAAVAAPDAGPGPFPQQSAE